MWPDRTLGKRSSVCPGRPINVIELKGEVQEFEPKQDAGTRQILSVQVDVSEVRFLRPSTRLVLAVNSMDVGRREGARGVIDTAARYTVAGAVFLGGGCHGTCAASWSRPHGECLELSQRHVADGSVRVLDLAWCPCDAHNFAQCLICVQPRLTAFVGPPAHFLGILHVIVSLPLLCLRACCFGRSQRWRLARWL